MSEVGVEGAHFMWEFRAGMSNADFADWLTRRDNEQRAIGAERALTEAAEVVGGWRGPKMTDGDVRLWLRARAAIAREEAGA